MRKVCSKCGIEKEVGEFHKSSRSKDGCKPACKGCAKSQNAEWTSLNKDKTAANRKRWRAENPDRANELGRRGYWKDVERSRARARDWREKNRGAVLTRRRAAYAELDPESKEKLRAKSRVERLSWARANPSENVAKTKKWIELNRERHNAKNRTLQGKWSEELRDSYVRRLLKDSGTPNPAPELIEEKRRAVAEERLLNKFIALLKENEDDK